jgi:transposase
MYPTDLTDSQWARLEPLLREPREDRHGGGRPRKYPLRRVADALFYVVKAGCQWRQLPVDSPPWQTVYQQLRGLADARDLGARPGFRAYGRKPKDRRQISSIRPIVR